MASFPIKKMSVFTSYKILRETVGIRLENENKIYSPNNSKLSQRILRCSLRCSCSDGYVLADCISGLHHKGVVKMENGAICIAHVSQLPGYSRFLVMVHFTQQIIVWILTKLRVGGIQ